MFERITPPPLPGAALGSIEPFWVAVNRYNDNGQLRRSRVFYRNVIGNIPEGHPD